MCMCCWNQSAFVPSYMSVAVRFIELTWACAWWNQCIFVPPYMSVALRFIESSLHWARNLPAFHHGGQIQPLSAQAWAQAVHWEKTGFQEEPGLASNTLCTWSWRCSYHSRGPSQMEKVCGWHLERQSILLDIHASSWWSFTLVGRKAMSSLSPGHPEQGSAGEAWWWIAETQMQCREVPNLHQRTSWASFFCWKPGRSHPFGNPGSSTPAPFESRSPCCCSPASTCEPQSHWRHGEATLPTTPILGIAARKIDPLWCRPGMGWCRSRRGHFWQEGDQQANAMGTVVRLSPEENQTHWYSIACIQS